MIGRSSRSRGVCEGIMYSISAERPAQVLERIKRSSATVPLDLEGLLTILEKHRLEKSLMKLLKEESEKGRSVRSLQ